MIEVFGKKQVTSREFPVVLFDAVGTLLHTMPPLEKYLTAQLNRLGARFSEEEIESKLLQFTRTLNEEIESQNEVQLSSAEWLRKFLNFLNDPALDLEKSFRSLRENFSLEVKLAISEGTHKFWSSSLIESINWGLSQIGMARFQSC